MTNRYANKLNLIHYFSNLTSAGKKFEKVPRSFNGLHFVINIDNER